MKRLTIIRGAPGSGKSTLANRLISDWINADIDFSAHEADSWMTDEAGNYRFDPTKLAYCHSRCQQRVCGAMYFGDNEIVVSNTSTKLWEIEPYLVLARIWNYEVRIIHTVGNYGNVHGVPEDKVQKMRDDYEPADGELVYNNTFI